MPLAPVSGLIAATALVLCLLMAWSSATVFRADLAYTSVQTEISFWGRPDYQPPPAAIAAAGRELDSILVTFPRQPDYLALRARYLLWRAYWSPDPAEKETLGQAVVASQHQSLLARPAHRQGWVKMVEYASRTRSGQSMVDLAGQRQRMLGTQEVD